MKSTVKKIHKALTKLYQIDLPYDPSEFLIEHPKITLNKNLQASLLVSEGTEAVTLGIYFNPEIKNTLLDFPLWGEGDWSKTQENAFATAVEEVSHFLYLLYHAQQGRPVSQFELELQGEIDKFLLLFFADKETPAREKFETTYDTLFSNFRWVKGLSIEEQTRYVDAHNYAKTFINQIGKIIESPSCNEKLFKELRKLYRMSLPDRISHLHSR